jgi:hypothetical protein
MEPSSHRRNREGQRAGDGHQNAGENGHGN